MKRVYEAKSSSEAHFLRGLLEAEKIQAIVRGEAIEVADGCAPSADARPTLWVQDQDEARAARVLEEYETAGPAARARRGLWKCQCGEIVGSQFTHCWYCGSERPAMS